MSLRSERAQRRSFKRRNQRILFAAILLILVAAIAYLVYASNTPEPPLDEGMTTTATGLQYKDLIIGEGPEAKASDEIRVHYTGWLTDGTKFDSSLDRNQPFEFILGIGKVIKGWDEGVVGMKAGGKRRLIIPPELGYGTRAAGILIPPNSTLVFEVELLEIK